MPQASVSANHQRHKVALQRRVAIHVSIVLVDSSRLARASRLAWGLTAPVVRRAWQLLGPPQAAVRMAKGALVAAAAALVATARAQQASQCSPQYLAQVQALCCDDGRGNDVCNGGQPSRCNGNCATMFLDFYDNCELQGQDRDMDALATTCRSTVRCPEARHRNTSPTFRPLSSALAACRPHRWRACLHCSWRWQFTRCISQGGGRACAREARCVPILEDLVSR